MFVSQEYHMTVFKISGELGTTFGQGILWYIYIYIEVDMGGYVYVSSHYSIIFMF